MNSMTAVRTPSPACFEAPPCEIKLLNELIKPKFIALFISQGVLVGCSYPNMLKRRRKVKKWEEERKGRRENGEFGEKGRETQSTHTYTKRYDKKVSKWFGKCCSFGEERFVISSSLSLRVFFFGSFSLFLFSLFFSSVFYNFSLSFLSPFSFFFFQIFLSPPFSIFLLLFLLLLIFRSLSSPSSEQWLERENDHLISWQTITLRRWLWSFRHLRVWESLHLFPRHNVTDCAQCVAFLLIKKKKNTINKWPIDDEAKNYTVKSRFTEL